MTDINKGEIGQFLRINMNEDISSATELIIRSQPKVGQTKEFIATAPAVNVKVGDVTLLANEYAEYRTLNVEDQDFEGLWRMKLKATFSSAEISQSNYVKYRVLA